MDCGKNGRDRNIHLIPNWAKVINWEQNKVKISRKLIKTWCFWKRHKLGFRKTTPSNQFARSRFASCCAGLEEGELVEPRRCGSLNDQRAGWDIPINSFVEGISKKGETWEILNDCIYDSRSTPELLVGLALNWRDLFLFVIKTKEFAPWKIDVEHKNWWFGRWMALFPMSDLDRRLFRKECHWWRCRRHAGFIARRSCLEHFDQHRGDHAGLRKRRQALKYWCL